MSNTDALREALALLCIVTDVHHKSSDERYTAEKELIRAIHRLASPTVAPADERDARPLIEALEMLAAQHSGIIASTARADCMAAIAEQTLRNYRAMALPGETT